jgi:hypothetical protein
LKEYVTDKIRLLVYVLEKGHSVFITGTWEHTVSAAQELADMQYGLKMYMTSHKILSLLVK